MQGVEDDLSRDNFARAAIGRGAANANNIFGCKLAPLMISATFFKHKAIEAYDEKDEFEKETKMFIDDLGKKFRRKSPFPKIVFT